MNLIEIQTREMGYQKFGTTYKDAINVGLSVENIVEGVTKYDPAFHFANGDVNTSTEVITLSTHGLSDGQPVYFTRKGSSTPPTGLTTGTVYYVIVVSTTTIKLATTHANAVAGTAINLTGAGSGNFFLSPFTTTLEYYDTSLSNQTVQVDVLTDIFTLDGLSNQLIASTLNKKAGVDYDPVELTLRSDETEALDSTAINSRPNNVLLNAHRMILAWEGGLASSSSAQADDWVIWYDYSRTNRAGLHSPFCSLLELEAIAGGSGVFDQTEEIFIGHIGGKTAFIDATHLIVNGRKIDMPDTSASAIVRLSSVAKVIEPGTAPTLGFTANKGTIVLQGDGKPGLNFLVTNNDITALVAKTDATQLSE